MIPAMNCFQKMLSPPLSRNWQRKPRQMLRRVGRMKMGWGWLIYAWLWRLFAVMYIYIYIYYSTGVLPDDAGKLQTKTSMKDNFCFICTWNLKQFFTAIMARLDGAFVASSIFKRIYIYITWFDKTTHANRVFSLETQRFNPSLPWVPHCVRGHRNVCRRQELSLTLTIHFFLRTL